MEKYYRIKKEHALRAGLNEMLRTEDGEDLLLSEKDIRMISLTIEERVAALNGSEYVETPAPETTDPEDENSEEESQDPEVSETEDPEDVEPEDVEPEDVEPEIIEEYE